jgi:DNA-binding beta-propeller fold protein YncE
VAESKLGDEQTIIVRYFPAFLAYMFLGSLVIYSWGGEKMPWLVIHITLPLCLLAGWFMDKLAQHVDADAIRENGGPILAALIPLFIILFGAVLRGRPALGGAGIAQQTQTIQWLAMALILVGLAGAIGWLWTRLGSQASAHVLALTVFVILSLFTIRAAWMASFTHGDIAKDMLVYVQSTRDVTNVVDRVEKLSHRLTSGKDLVISYDDESSWPLTWYFRDYKNQKFEPKGPTAPPDTPVVIVGLVNDDKVKPLMGKYDRTHLKLRWWFPEFYKSADETARTFLDQAGKAKIPPNPTWGDTLRLLITDPVARSRVWHFWLYRDLWDPNTGKEVTYGQLGSTDFIVYVRKDLSDSFWSGGPAVTKSAAPSVEQSLYERAVRQVSAIQTIGGQRGAGNGQFADPKNIALDAAGNIYVADTLNHRVQKFDQDGTFLLAFGSQGEGDGQFSEPWGLAVDGDGNIYVCDTWNHRIQKFDKDGKFLLKWGGGLIDTKGIADGQPGVFYGPRVVVVDRDGNLLVSDTGNKRIQKFDPMGKFLGQFGVVGTLDGQFNEQVGLAVDGNGNIYVADTWNRRIERFDANFKYLGQWPVLGWDSESIVNKPYLATDADGNVYASDPEGHRIIKFTSSGSVLAVWGKYGSDAASFNLPVGVAVDAAGNIFVADAMNQRILKFAPVK